MVWIRGGLVGVLRIAKVPAHSAGAAGSQLGPAESATAAAQGSPPPAPRLRPVRIVIMRSRDSES
jgi:hypothetical protein